MAERMIYYNAFRDHDRGWTIMLAIFAIAIVLLSFSSAKWLLFPLVGPLSLIFTTKAFSRYHVINLGVRGVMNILFLTSISSCLIIAAIVLGLLPGILLATSLMFSAPLMIYKRYGIIGSITGSIRIVRSDFIAYAVLWMYSSLLPFWGLLTIFGILDALPNALLLRKDAFMKAIRTPDR